MLENTKRQVFTTHALSRSRYVFNRSLFAIFTQVESPYSPRSFAARLSASPLKLYFACAYNTASYAGYQVLFVALKKARFNIKVLLIMYGKDKNKGSYWPIKNTPPWSHVAFFCTITKHFSGSFL